MMKFTPHRLGAFLGFLLGASLVQAGDKPSIRAVRFEPAFWLFSGYAEFIGHDIAFKMRRD